MKNQKGFGIIEGLLVIIAITLIIGVVFYVVNANKEYAASETPNNSQVLENETIEKAPQNQVPELIKYDPIVEIRSKQDVSKLDKADDVFKNFIASQVSTTPTPDQFCDIPKVISVDIIYKNEFARGGVGGCGGARTVWKKIDGIWQGNMEFGGGHTATQCADIIKHKIPKIIVDSCFDIENPAADETGIIPNPNN